MCDVVDPSAYSGKQGSFGIPGNTHIPWLSIALHRSPLFNDLLALTTFE